MAADHADDLAPDDPHIDGVAHRIVAAPLERYGSGLPPELDVTFEIPRLIQGTVNAASRRGKDSTP
ncbi:hypothetical protein [Streptomyces sp. NPDC048361]|uniref:hypothetical protein n=1 Tax=Streptomyces sp. NPDC048361 TaxID=3154720 RepID=UPI00344964FB